MLGLLLNPALRPSQAFEILHRTECTPLAEQEPDIYGLLYEREGELHARFWNPDGSPEDVCGNALRCVPWVLGDPRGQPVDRVAVTTRIGQVDCFPVGPGIGGVRIPTETFSLDDVDGGDVLVNVGTPHRVRFVDDLDAPELLRLGQAWAKSAIPIAATFVRVQQGVLHVRSIERGVVRETGSSGTAAVAAYLAYERVAGDSHRDFREARFPCGRRLKVKLDASANQIVLYGACRLAFSCDMVTDSERNACSA